MKTGKISGIVELAQEIERRAHAKKDVVTNTKHVTLISTDPGDGTRGNVEIDIGREIRAGINTIGHQQIAEHADIPKKYYDRMLTSNPGLLATNVNAWFRQEPQPRLARILDGNLRAFLSDRFRPLENEDLAEAVLPPIQELGLDIMSAEITDRRLYIKAVDPKVTRELKALGGKFGDGAHNIVRCLAPAITISNSEVGMGALSVLGGVYDGFCSNLATFGERSTRKYHVGGKHELAGEDTYALLSDETRRKTDAAIWAQVGDIVRAAFDRARFDSLCDKIAETATHKIEGDPIQVVSLSARRFGLNETQGKSVLKHLIEGGDLSRFGLFNAVTRASQDEPDYDVATDFERIGGQIIELPATEWKELAKAA